MSCATWWAATAWPSLCSAGVPGTVAAAPCGAAEGSIAGAGAGSRLLYFHGHYDVVPVQNRMQFTLQRD